MKIKKTALMLLSVVIFIQISGNVSAQPENQNSERPVKPAAGLQRPVLQKSPEILSDNKVVFRIKAPTAHEVAVTGEWTDMKQNESMTKDSDGIWSVTVGPLSPEYYGYKFLVDGATVLDPNNDETRRDWLGYESILLMPGKQTELYFARDVPSGTVAKVWYESPSLGFRRRMYFYTPPGYETSDIKYPVLYLLHGGMNDEDTWMSMGRVNVIMDNLIAQGKAEPMIIVMPNGNPDQAAVSFESYPFTPDPKFVGPEPLNMFYGYFESSLVKDIVPFVETNYRVLANSANRAITGYSMGGGQTYRIALDNPEVFGYIGLFGPAAFPQDSDAAKLDALEKANPELVWIACGVEDSLHVNVTDKLIPLFEKHHIKHSFLETPGGHNWINWRIFFTANTQTLFK